MSWSWWMLNDCNLSFCLSENDEVNSEGRLGGEHHVQVSRSGSYLGLSDSCSEEHRFSRSMNFWGNAAKSMSRPCCTFRLLRHRGSSSRSWTQTSITYLTPLLISTFGSLLLIKRGWRENTDLRHRLTWPEDPEINNTILTTRNAHLTSSTTIKKVNRSFLWLSPLKLQPWIRNTGFSLLQHIKNKVAWEHSG